MKPHQPRQYIDRVNRIYHDKANKISLENEACAHIQNSLKPKKTFEDMERLMRGIYDT